MTCRILSLPLAAVLCLGTTGYAAKPVAKPTKSSKKTTVQAAPKVGKFTDVRNGKSYKTIVIGKQTWMAENLNFPIPQSSCYESQKSNCEKFGRLYEWEAAKIACPTGWHLPTDDEWNTLETGWETTDSAGRVLKSTSGWDANGNGADTKGFCAIPAGNLDRRGIYTNQGSTADFWTASSRFGGGAISRHLNYEDNKLAKSSREKTNGLSVRCLRDGN
ncbi:MAG: fibrobacter succinogenes major paralogous domain-containing protein [Fibrobacterota bacterium]